MALLFVGPRSIGGAVFCVRISDAFAGIGKGILAVVQADGLSPTRPMLPTATMWTLRVALSRERVAGGRHHAICKSLVGSLEQGKNTMTVTKSGHRGYAAAQKAAAISTRPS
jgi:hypothetical protein